PRRRHRRRRRGRRVLHGGHGVRRGRAAPHGGARGRAPDGTRTPPPGDAPELRAPDRPGGGDPRRRPRRRHRLLAGLPAPRRPDRHLPRELQRLGAGRARGRMAGGAPHHPAPRPRGGGGALSLVSHIPCAARAAYPRRPGNQVRPLIDGEPAFRRICEAVEAARARVWVTVAFVDRDVALPDGRGTPFDVLDRAAARGLDVRVLFWREPELDRTLPGSGHFGGTPEERAWLAARGSGLSARWDHVPRYCHHQKAWMIDAGEPGETAFVGGINLDHGSIVPQGHPQGPHPLSVHDLYLEVRRPAATDVAHNFVQRWNEASERGAADGAWPDLRRAADLEFPRLLSPAAGEVPVQITRTVRAGRYVDATPAPGADSFPIADGEKSVLE